MRQLHRKKAAPEWSGSLLSRLAPEVVRVPKWSLAVLNICPVRLEYQLLEHIDVVAHNLLSSPSGYSVGGEQ